MILEENLKKMSKKMLEPDDYHKKMLKNFEKMRPGNAVIEGKTIL